MDAQNGSNSDCHLRETQQMWQFCDVTGVCVRLLVLYDHKVINVYSGRGFLCHLFTMLRVDTREYDNTGHIFYIYSRNIHIRQ